MLSRALKASTLVLIVFVVLLFLLASPPRFLSSVMQPVRMLLLTAAMDAVSASLNGDLEIGTLEGSLLSTPTLRGIRLTDAQGVVIVHIEALSLRYRVADFLRGRIRIEELEVQHPWLLYAVDGQGRTNLAEVLSTDTSVTEADAVSGDSGVPVSVERIRIRSGSADLKIPSVPGAREITNLNLDMGVQLGETGMQLHVLKGEVNASPADVRVEAFQGILSMVDGQTRFDGWELRTGASQLRLQDGALGGPQPVDMRLDLTALDLSEIARLVGADRLHGVVEGQMRAAGPAESLELVGRLAVGDGEIALSGAIDTQGSVPDYRGTVRVSDVNLADLIARDAYRGAINTTLKVTGSGLSANELAGEFDLTVDSSRIGDLIIEPSEIRLTADSGLFRIKVFDFKASAFTAVLAGEVDLAGRSELDYKVALDLANLNGLADGIDFGGQALLSGSVGGTWPDTYIEGKLKSDGLVWDDMALQTLQLDYRVDGPFDAGARAVAKLDGRALGVGEIAIESVNGEVAYSIEGDRHLARFDARIDQSSTVKSSLAGELSNDGQRTELVLEQIGASLDGRVWRNQGPVKIHHAPDALHLHPFRLQQAEGAVEGSGSLVGEQFQDVVLKAKEIDLTLLGRLAGLPALTGSRGDLTAEIAGTLEAPALSSRVVLRTDPGQGPLFEVAVLALRYAERELTGRARVEQGGRRVVGAELALPVDLAFKGKRVWERLVDAPISLVVDIERPALDALSAGLPGWPSLAGTLRGRLGVAGSYTGLAVDATFDLEGLALPGVVDGIEGALAVRGKLESAASFQALREALAASAPRLSLRALEARSSQMDVLLPADQAPMRLTFHDLLLDADGQWDGRNVIGRVHQFHVLAAGADLPDTQLNLAANINAETVTIERLSATTAGSELLGKGEFGFADQHLAFHWDIPRLELKEFMGDLPQNLPSELAGRIGLEGTPQAAEITTSIEYAGGVLDGKTKLQLEGDAPGYQAVLRATGLDIARFQPELSGRLNLEFDAQGTGFDAGARHALNATLNSRDAELLPEMTGRLQAELMGQSLAVDTLSLQSTGLEMQAKGVLSAAEESDFDYRVVIEDLSALKGYVPGDLKMRGTLNGTILGDDGKLNSSNTLSVEDWGYGGLSGGEVGAAFKIDDLLTSPRAVIKVEMDKLEGPGSISGSLRLDGSYQQDRGDFSLSVNEGIFARSLVAGQVETENGIEVRLEPLRLRHDDREWENARPIQVVVDASGAVAVQGVELVSQDQRISASGAWSPSGAVSVDARIDGLRLGGVVEAFASGMDDLDGLVNADVTVAGVLEEPQVNVVLKATALQFGQQPLGEIHGDITTVGPVVTGRARWLHEQNEWLTLDGRLDRGASDSIDGVVRIEDLDLSILQSLSPEIIQSGGRLALDLRLSGSTDRPLTRGALDLQDGNLQLATLGAAYSDIQGRIVFEGERANIEGLRIDSETGPAELSGWVATSVLSLEELDLRLVANAFNAVETAAYSAVVSSDLALQGSGDDLKAAGSLEVVKGHLRYDRLPSSSGPTSVEPWELTVEGVFGAVPSQVTDAPGEQWAEALGAELPTLRADVQVTMPGNFWVRGAGTAVEFRGDVRVVKQPEGTFTVTGDVAAARGFASFFGRRFSVEEGQIEFTGSEVIDPILNITASHPVSNYTTYVSVTGRSSNPAISFSSDPELEESDIISLLVFGRTADQLTASQEASLGSSAVNAAGQWAAGVLDRQIGEGFGLDMVAIELGSDTTRSSVGVGQYIRPDLFAFYERIFRDPRASNRSGNTVGIQKRLDERQTIEVTGSDLGETAVDWFWRLDY